MQRYILGRQLTQELRVLPQPCSCQYHAFKQHRGYTYSEQQHVMQEGACVCEQS